MDRRDMLKTVGALAVGGSLPAVSSGKAISPLLTRRFERYVTYDRMMEDPDFSNEVYSFIAHTWCSVWKKIAKNHLVPTKWFPSPMNSDCPHFDYFRATLYCDNIVFPAIKNLTIYGDHFLEIIRDSGHSNLTIYGYGDHLEKIRNSGVFTQDLPLKTMYRIETIHGNLVEFQQSKEGPDYRKLINNPIQINNNETGRFHPNDIHHMRVNVGGKGFYPYGCAAIHLHQQKEKRNEKFINDVVENFRELCVRLK